MGDRFDWQEVEEDTIIENVSAVAVYFNPKGAVVIRQQGDFATEDQVIVIPARLLPALVAKLGDMQQLLAEQEGEH
jgi:hypothetical protein